MTLKDDFNYETLSLNPDFEGNVVATLIASKHNKSNRAAVVYIHGYIDYFFHTHLAEKCLNRNYNFYALDLRKSGRSILKHQRPYFTDTIEAYFEDITAAIASISKSGTKTIYLLGHSTGGLTVLSYMNSSAKSNLVKGIVLISPFLDMPQPSWVTNIIYPIIKGVVTIMPYAKVNGVVSSVYIKSIHKDYKGEWDFDTTLKPVNGVATYFKWIIAVRQAQLQLQGKKCNSPILVLHASQSVKALRYSPKVMVSDAVLDVNDMKRIAPTLGNKVTLKAIKNGMHDLFLSQKEARETAFLELFKWLKHQQGN